MFIVSADCIISSLSIEFQQPGYAIPVSVPTQVSKLQVPAKIENSNFRTILAMAEFRPFLVHLHPLPQSNFLTPGLPSIQWATNMQIILRTGVIQFVLSVQIPLDYNTVLPPISRFSPWPNG